MSTFTRSVLAFQSLPILLLGSRAVLGSETLTGTGQLLAGASQVALHIQGLSSLTLGSMQLALAVQASKPTLRLVVGAMIPTKILAAYYFAADGESAVAWWEGLTGVLYAAMVFWKL